jgi:hypothetical protein
MATYTIIGGDQKEYGPISADDVRRWITEGRLDGQSRMRAENDTEWRPLSTFPEFAQHPAPPNISPLSPPPMASHDNPDHDYQLDLGGCFSRSYELLKSQFGVVFVAVLLFAAVEGAIAGLSAIPLIGPLFSLANMVVAGPLLGGLFYVFILAIRQEPTSAGDVFAGFRRQFMHLFLGKFISGMLAGLCMLPFVIFLVFMIVRMALAIQGHGEPSPEEVRLFLLTLIPVGLPLFLVCLVPMIYLQVRWIFTLPLIIDRQMEFWPAMKLSWKMVGKHWWQVFGLLVVAGLLNLVGLAACCVGAMFTAPISYGAMMYAYETIFPPSGPKAG